MRTNARPGVRAGQAGGSPSTYPPAHPQSSILQVADEAEFDAALAAAGPAALVVVDFNKPSCGACRYIAPGFVKLCKAAGQGGDGADVVFLKHDVMDE